jgi:hypothetical protein
MTAPPRSAVPFCNPTKNNSTPAVRASHFSLFWDSPSLRDQEKGHANRKETERLSLAVGRSAHKSQGSGGEGERERAAFFFLWIPSVSQSHGILPERHKHLRPCYCEVLVSTSAKERERRRRDEASAAAIAAPLLLRLPAAPAAVPPIGGQWEDCTCGGIFAGAVASLRQRQHRLLKRRRRRRSSCEYGVSSRG